MRGTNSSFAVYNSEAVVAAPRAAAAFFAHADCTAGVVRSYVAAIVPPCTRGERGTQPMKENGVADRAATCLRLPHSPQAGFKQLPLHAFCCAIERGPRSLAILLIYLHVLDAVNSGAAVASPRAAATFFVVASSRPLCMFFLRQLFTSIPSI